MKKKKPRILFAHIQLFSLEIHLQGQGGKEGDI